MSKLKLDLGDIVLVKSFSLIGYLIGNSLGKSKLTWYMGKKKARGRRSNHNGLIGRKDGVIGIYEMLGSGLMFTSLEDYSKLVKKGKCELKFATPCKPLEKEEREKIQVFLSSSVGLIKYDYRSYISHIWRSVFHLPIISAIHSKSKLWCTELVKKCYDDIGRDLFEDEMIDPCDIEAAVTEGKLIIVGEVRNV